LGVSTKNFAILGIFSVLVLGSFGFSQEAYAADDFSIPLSITNTETFLYNSSMVTDGTAILVVYEEGVFLQTDVFIIKSTDGGTTWSSPVNISNSAASSEKPTIITFGTNILVTWYDFSSGNNEILFSKSTDGGATWSSPVNLSNDATSSEGPSITIGGTNILITWFNNDVGNSEILFSKSTDGGTTWSSPFSISNTESQSTQPTIITFGTDILITWTEHIVDSQEVVFSKSTDGGVTWSSPFSISNTVSQSTQPAIITFGTDILITWTEFIVYSQEVVFSKSTDGGVTWSSPVNLSQTPAVQTISGSSSIATDGTDILVAFQENSKFFKDIMVVKSTDGGVTWSSPNSIAYAGSGDSVFSPTILTDGTNFSLIFHRSLLHASDDIYFSVYPGTGFITQQLTNLDTKVKPISCETSIGNPCGDGRLKSQIKLSTKYLGDIETGVGKANLSFKGSSGVIAGASSQFIGNDLTYQFDTVGNTLTIEGFVTDKNDNNWNLDILIENIIENQNGKKLKGDFDLTLESTANGNKLKQTILGGVILNSFITIG